jgi:hypothetical protein
MFLVNPYRVLFFFLFPLRYGPEVMHRGQRWCVWELLRYGPEVIHRAHRWCAGVHALAATGGHAQGATLVRLGAPPVWTGGYTQGTPLVCRGTCSGSDRRSCTGGNAGACGSSSGMDRRLYTGHTAGVQGYMLWQRPEVMHRGQRWCVWELLRYGPEVIHRAHRWCAGVHALAATGGHAQRATLVRLGAPPVWTGGYTQGTPLVCRGTCSGSDRRSCTGTTLVRVGPPPVSTGGVFVKCHYLRH